MKKTVIYILAALMLSLCACQKTPDTEAVINKGDNKAEKAIEASPDPAWDGAQPVFPERWEDDIKTKYKEIIINADVVTMGQSEYPVYIVEKDAFSNADTLKWGKYMFPDITAWRNSVRPTKEYLAKAIQTVTELDAKDEYKNDHLEAVNSSLSSATESDANYKACKSFDDIPVEDLKEVAVLSKSGEIGIINTGLNRLLVQKYAHGIIHSEKTVEMEEEEPNSYHIGPLNVNISLDEAKAMVEEFMKNMGIEGFEFYRAEKARCRNMFTTLKVSDGWDVRYVRSFGYAPVSASEYDASNGAPFKLDDDPVSFSKALPTETIGFYVDEGGIAMIDYQNPYKIKGVANENVKLMDFDTLTAGIKKTFTAAVSSPKQYPGYLVIEEIALSVVPQYKKDSNDIYMMPAWICKIGDYVSEGEGGLSSFYIPGEQRFDGWITVVFNAIDGTRVEVPFY